MWSQLVLAMTVSCHRPLFFLVARGRREDIMEPQLMHFHFQTWHFHFNEVAELAAWRRRWNCSRDDWVFVWLSRTMQWYPENENAFLRSRLGFNYGTDLLPYLMSTETYCVMLTAPLSSSLWMFPIRVFESCNIIENICPNVKQTQRYWRIWHMKVSSVFWCRYKLLSFGHLRMLETRSCEPSSSFHLSERVIPWIRCHLHRYSKHTQTHTQTCTLSNEKWGCFLIPTLKPNIPVSPFGWGRQSSPP